MLKFTTVILSMCFAFNAQAQDQSQVGVDTGALRGVIAQKQTLEAQMKRLKSVLSYQSEVIALGKQDPTAAYTARRVKSQCDAETLGGLCVHLKATYK